jgi:hypothetical protein
MAPDKIASGDSITGFRLVSVDKKQLSIEIDYEVEAYHGNTIYVGGWLYDSNSQAFGGYKPTVIPSTGKGKAVLVITCDKDPSLATEIEFFLFEPSKAPFIKRRFPLSLKPGSQSEPAPPLKVEEAPGYAVGSVSGRPKPEDRWEWIGAQAKTLITGGEQLYMVNNTTGDIFQYNGSPGSWTRIGGPAHSFVAHLRSLYALSMDKGGIYEYLGKPDKWARIHGAAKAICAGGASLFFTDPGTGDIYEYHPKSTKNIKYDIEGPQKVGGPGHMFVVDAFKGTLFGLSTDRKAVFIYERKVKRWKKIAGPVDKILAGSSTSKVRHEVFAIQPQNKGVLMIVFQEKHERLTGTTVPEEISRTQIGGPAAELAVGIFEGKLWGLSPDRSGIFVPDNTQKNESGKYQWKKIGGPAWKIFSGGKCSQGYCKDLLYIIDSERNVWRYRDPDKK